jgi:hypothetical protein
MIEITEELKKTWRLRSQVFYMRSSIKSFVTIALIHQENPKIGGAAVYGKVMAGLYREYRLANKFFEVV